MHYQIPKPVIAISNKVFPVVEELLTYCRGHHLQGVDYTFNTKALVAADLESDRPAIEAILAQNMEIRYHLQFYAMEIANVDKGIAASALQLHKDSLDRVAEYHGRYATLHIGLGVKSMDAIDYETALENLGKLVQYAKDRQICLCLENLTKAWTNHPGQLLEMLEKTGAKTTFDLGHARSCPSVLSGQMTSLGFLRVMAPYVHNAHVYEIEEVDQKTGIPYHVALQNLDGIQDLLTCLLGTPCDWWLIELTNPEEMDKARQLLQAYLAKMVG